MASPRQRSELRARGQVARPSLDGRCRDNGSMRQRPTGSADVADAIVAAIQAGDLAELRQLLADHPDVVSAPLGGRHKTRTPLHVVTDWPGYWPNGPEVVRVLVEAGADPNAVGAPGDETPLHWAASSDDADVALALV